MRSSYFLPNELLADPRPQIHNFQLGRFQDAVLGELDVGLAGLRFDADVAEVAEKAVPRVPACGTGPLARELSVEGPIQVLLVVYEVFDAVSVDFDGRRYFVNQTGARRVEMNA